MDVAVFADGASPPPSGPDSDYLVPPPHPPAAQAASLPARLSSEQQAPSLGGKKSSTRSSGRRYSASDSLTPKSSYPFSQQSGLAERELPLEPLDEEPSRDPRDTSAPTPTSTTQFSSTSVASGIDFDGLSWPSTGTRRRLEASPEETKAQKERLADAVRTILECVGEDVGREGLVRTPHRFAEAMMFFTQGYEQNLRDIVNGAIFNEDHDEMVIVKDIEVMSLCEHHLVPFTGKMYIGYVPNGRVLGLSKFARIADMFSRRLQVQERLTKQVAGAINEVLKPQGVAVVIESSHLCMVMRGVQQTQSTTTTSCMMGAFERRERTRQEFLSLALRR